MGQQLVVRKSRFTRSRAYFILGLIFFISVLVFLFHIISFVTKDIQSDEALPVRNLRLEGKLNMVSKTEIINIAKQYAAGKNIATLDLQKISAALLDIPWIARVVVSKKMPDTLILEIVEHKASALFNDGVYDFVHNDVFYPDMSNFKSNFVQLRATNEADAKEVYEHAVVFVNTMKGYPYSIEEVLLDDIRSYRIKLSNGIWLILGRDSPKGVIISRLKIFLQAFPKTKLNPQQVEYIDLRYDIGFAVGKRN